MKFILNIRSRPDPDDSIPKKHKRFFTGIRKLSAPWGPATADCPQARDPGNNYLSVVNLSKVLGPGIKGSLNYHTRKELTDEGMSDDWLGLEFDPEKVDYGTLINSAFERYVTSLGAYVGTIKDEQSIFKHFNRWQRTKGDYRSAVFRIHPVNYFDRLLCKRAFGLRPEQVVNRLSKEVERAALINDGALIIVTSKLLNLKESDAIERRIRPLLTT
jgi:hypothetical protein